MARADGHAGRRQRRTVGHHRVQAGSENPDVRKVIAQILDYGSALWRLPYDDLEAAAKVVSPGFPGSLVDHVGARLTLLGDETVDADALRRGIESALGSGEFVSCTSPGTSTLALSGS